MSDRPESLCVKMVSEARHTFSPKAASQLWFKLNLPRVPAMLDPAAQRDLFDSSLKVIDSE